MSNLIDQEAIQKPIISIDNYDIVSINLQKLDAMITAISGEGFDRFSNMEADAQHWYLLTISELTYDAVTAIKAD